MTVWVVWAYVALTAIMELVGKLKSSGKTTLLMALIAAVVNGRPFLGFRTERTGVVILTEQNAASFRRALDRAGLLARDDVLVLFWHAVRSLPWPAVAKIATEAAVQRGYRLLIVDTLGQFAGITGDGENNAGSALEAMRPLQEAAALGLAVVVSRHERKGGGEIGESGRGSSAFSGAVDIVVSLRRPEGQTSESVRVLQALSRFDETPAELVIELKDGEYVALGSAQDVKTQDARRAVLDVLPTDEGDAITTSALLDTVADRKIRRTILTAVLAEHIAAGVACRLGSGKRGDPFRYWRSPEMVSAGTTGAPAETNGSSLLCGNCGVVSVDRPGETCTYCADEDDD